MHKTFALCNISSFLGNKCMEVANTRAIWTEKKKINYIYLLSNSQFCGGWDSLDVGFVAAQEFPVSLHDCGI